jgi:hypothetical protein
MLDNLFYRLSVWWGDILGWDWQRKRRKQWNIEGSDD